MISISVNVLPQKPIRMGHTELQEDASRQTKSDDKVKNRVVQLERQCHNDEGICPDE